LGDFLHKQEAGMTTYVLNYVPAGFVSTASGTTLVGQITPGDVFNPGSATDVGNSTATQWRLTNPNGFVLVINGTGFTYDPTTHRANAGTITGIGLYEASDTTFAHPIATFSSLNGGTSAATFASDLFGTGQSVPHAYTATWDYVMSGSDTVTLNGLTTADEGLGNDTATVSNAGGYIRPGPGTDSIAFGTNSASNGLLYDDITYTGLTTSGISANLNSNSLTDPWGFTDSWTGQITYIRGTNLADNFIGNNLGDKFAGIGGNDTFTGGTGYDYIDYRFDADNNGPGAVNVNLATGTATDGFGNTDTFTSIEGVDGTNGDDTLRGGDIPLGGTSNYTLEGEAGNDTLIAGSGGMFARPGAGNDTIIGGPATNILSYDDYTGTNGVTVDLNQSTLTDPWGGTDTFSGIQYVRGTKNADTFIAGPNGNSFQGLKGNDTLTGGAGFDVADYRFDASYSGGGGAVTVNLGTGTATDGFGNTDALTSIEGVYGTSGGDNLTGGNAVVPGGTLYQLYGRGGNDTLNGGTYGTYFEPGDGDDTIVGHAVPNNLALSNLYMLSYGDYTGANGVTLNVGSGSVNDPFGHVDTFSGINAVRGTVNGDTLIASGTGTLFQGIRGNDTFTGGAGFDSIDYSRDFVYGGGGAVTVNLSAGTAIDGFGNTDTFTSIEGAIGTNNADTLIGNNANNSLIGLAGNDIFRGGAGNDTLTGGSGADTFVFAPGDNADTITDFSAAQGDTIDLTGFTNIHTLAQVLARASQSGSDAFLNFGNGDTLTLSNTNAAGLTPANFVLAPDEDFNRDGTSDVLWRDPSSGDIGYWGVNNNVATWHDFGVADPAYSVVGIGDFNANGTSDVLWRNNVNGDTGYWGINNNIAAWHDYGITDPAYSAVGIGHFNGDGSSDVLWRNNGNGDTGYWGIGNNGDTAAWHDYGITNPAYSVVGIGDFNGDSTSDVLWRNNSDGDTGYWAISNNAATWHDFGTTSTAYAIVGVGDLSGDGISDAVWRNASTGDTGYWAINNTSAAWHDFGITDTAYSVVGVHDYNGDGAADVLWRNNSSGDTGYWGINNNGNTATWHDFGNTSTAYNVQNV
jgi:Ca2+-binding RTX toxin-like protein